MYIVNVHFFQKWGNAFSAINLSFVFIHVEFVKIWKHQRQVCARRGSLFHFSCGESTLDITQQYKYLGLILQEHLDYSITAKAVAQSASRALGLLIAKAKAYGGFPFGTFTRLYDATVNSV